MLKKLLSLFGFVPLIANATAAQTYSQPVFTDPNRLTKIQQAIPKIDQLYSDYIRNNHIPGCCYSIVVDGKLIHTRCEGYSDVDKKILVTPKTIFRIASLSKSFRGPMLLFKIAFILIKSLREKIYSIHFIGS